MTVPEGFPNPDNYVCKLEKSLYGLRQASRQWFSKLTSALLLLGFSQSKNDYSFFIKHASPHITIVAIYVDDLLITGSDMTCITQLKVYLDKAFSIKDLGILHYFLGLEVSYLNDGIALTQNKFTMELLKDVGFSTSSPSCTPLPLHLKLNNDDGFPLSKPFLYRQLFVFSC